jgi:hypothetical protein
MAIADYPGLGDFCDRSTKGYCACFKCHAAASHYNPSNPKSQIVFGETAKKLLPSSARNDFHFKPKTVTDYRTYTAEAREQERERLESIRRHRDENPEDCRHFYPARVHLPARVNGFGVLYAFAAGLVYWGLYEWRLANDAMHFVKNLMLSIVRVLIGWRDPGDTNPADHLVHERLISDKVHLGDQRHSSISGPPGWKSQYRRPFSKNAACTASDWLRTLLFTAGYLLVDLLDEETHKTVTNLLNVVGRMVSSEIDLHPAAMGQLENDLLSALAAFEAAFPRSEHTINLHSATHFAGVVRRWGSMRWYWMFFFERLIGWLKRHVKSRVRPEISMFNAFYRHQSTHSNPDKEVLDVLRVFLDAEDRQALGERLGFADDDVPEPHHETLVTTARVCHFDHSELAALEVFMMSIDQGYAEAIQTFRRVRERHGVRNSWQVRSTELATQLQEAVLNQLNKLPVSFQRAGAQTAFTCGQFKRVAAPSQLLTRHEAGNSAFNRGTTCWFELSLLDLYQGRRFGLVEYFCEVTVSGQPQVLAKVRLYAGQPDFVYGGAKLPVVDVTRYEIKFIPPRHLGPLMANGEHPRATANPTKRVMLYTDT